MCLCARAGVLVQHARVCLPGVAEGFEVPEDIDELAELLGSENVEATVSGVTGDYAPFDFTDPPANDDDDAEESGDDDPGTLTHAKGACNNKLFKCAQVVCVKCAFNYDLLKAGALPRCE